MSLWKSSIDHSLADIVQASAFLAEGEMFLKPGGLMVAWEIRHDDFESLSAEEVEAICERFEQALGHLGDMDMLHVVRHRLPAPNYPEREFPTRAAALVDAERRAAFGNERYWVNCSRIYQSHYFPAEATARTSSAFFAGGGGEGASSRQYEIERFRERARAFGDALSGVARVRRLTSAEMFHDLHLCLTGLEHPIGLPSVPVHLDEVLADQTFFGGLYPRVSHLHIRPVAINSYPAETIPQLLWFVLKERGRMRFTLRWMPASMRSPASATAIRCRGQWARRRQGLLQIILAADECASNSRQPLRRRDGGRCRRGDRARRQWNPIWFSQRMGAHLRRGRGPRDLRARELVTAGCRTRVSERGSRMSTRLKRLRPRSRATAGRMLRARW